MMIVPSPTLLFDNIEDLSHFVDCLHNQLQEFKTSSQSQSSIGPKYAQRIIKEWTKTLQKKSDDVKEPGL